MIDDRSLIRVNKNANKKVVFVYFIFVIIHYTPLLCSEIIMHNTPFCQTRQVTHTKQIVTVRSNLLLT